jgi:GNAT superfamily N-acetyltransferase
MPPPTIRRARSDEYDEIGRVWMDSWVSTGLEDASHFLLANLRARVRHEVESGWSLFVADDRGALAAMLALHLPENYLDQLFVAPEYQGKNLGRALLTFTLKSGCAACAKTRRRGAGMSAKEAVEPMTGFIMKYYRWKKEGTPQ